MLDILTIDTTAHKIIAATRSINLVALNETLAIVGMRTTWADVGSVLGRI